MISFPHFEEDRCEWLLKILSANFTRDFANKTCASKWKNRLIFSEMLILGFTRNVGTMSGNAHPSRMKMMFSFHEPSSTPNQGPGGLWDCAVPHWSTFRLHLACDLVTDCLGNEDELACPGRQPCPSLFQTLSPTPPPSSSPSSSSFPIPSSSRTLSSRGLGFLVDGRYCYLLLRLPERTAYDEAKEMCADRGASLAVLEMPEEVKSARRVLKRVTNFNAFVGLKQIISNMNLLYTQTIVWETECMAYGVSYYFSDKPPLCGSFNHIHDSYIQMVHCHSNKSEETDFALCELNTESSKAPTTTALDLFNGMLKDIEEVKRRSKAANNKLQEQLQGKDDSRLRSNAMEERLQIHHQRTTKLIQCPSKHLTYSFLRCDQSSQCEKLDASHTVYFGSSEYLTCSRSVPTSPPMFPCDSGVLWVSYTMLCDNRQDCPDGSDEAFCDTPPCPAGGYFQCGDSRQCFHISTWCDGKLHCPNGADEKGCQDSDFSKLKSYVQKYGVFGKQAWQGYREENEEVLTSSVPPPAVVTFSPNGLYTVSPLNGTLCPETHFQCPSGYCLPVFVLCNGIADCLGHEDERNCESYSCPGFYKCRRARQCLHPTHLCDGILQCPLNDDELLCDVSCPNYCQCHGLAFFCSQAFDAHKFPELRFLEARGTGMTFGELHRNSLLIHLSLALCNVYRLEKLQFPILHSLDLSENNLPFINTTDLIHLRHLNLLRLAGNPLRSSIFTGLNSSTTLPSLAFLDVSNVPIDEVDLGMLARVPGLKFLNLSGCGTDRIVEGSSTPNQQLQVLDLRGSPLSQFSPWVMKNFKALGRFYVDNFKLCCIQVVPDSLNEINCFAPPADFSSCEFLISNRALRVWLAVVAVMSLVGTLIMLASQVYVSVVKDQSTVTDFLMHLCLSDLLTGTYAAMIFAADLSFEGNYLWIDDGWRSGKACKFAGFLCFVSNEASFFILFLNSVDRKLSLRLSSRRLFTSKSAHLCCILAWIMCCVLGYIPLLMGDVYGQTSYCMPLPINVSLGSGHFVFGVMVYLNSLLCGSIAALQMNLRRFRLSHTLEFVVSSEMATLMDLSKRFNSICITKIIFWLPIYVLAFMAQAGSEFPVVVTEVVLTVAVPFNSAFDSVLYGVSLLKESRRNTLRKRLIKRTRLHAPE